MQEEDRQVSYRQTQYNLWPNNPANIEYNYKPAGNFLKTWNVGANQIREFWRPETGEFDVVYNGEDILNATIDAPILAGLARPRG